MNHPFAKSKNILVPAEGTPSAEAYSEYDGMILTPYMLFRGQYKNSNNKTVYTLGDELVEWGDSKGYNWTKDTEFDEMSLDIEYGCTFTNGGHSVKFLDTAKRKTPNPYNNYWWGSGSSALQVSKAEKSSYDVSDSELMFRDEGIHFTADDGKDTFGRIPGIEMIMGSSVSYPVRLNYRGNVTINCIMKFTFHFTVDGRKYTVCMKNPEVSPSFQVQDLDRSERAADGDVTAAVIPKSGNKSTDNEQDQVTEHDQVTKVRHGDQINYEIHFDTDLEKQMLAYLYTSLSVSDAFYPDTTMNQMREHGFDLRNLYYNSWSQPAFSSVKDKEGNILDDDGNIVAWKDGEKYVDKDGKELSESELARISANATLTKPRVHVTFQFPDDKDVDGHYILQYAKENLDNIEVTCKDSSKIPWKLDANSIEYDTSSRMISLDVFIDPHDIGQCVDAMGGAIDLGSYKAIGQAGKITSSGRKIIIETLARMGSNPVTVKIPGVKVSDKAKVNTYYTVKATAKGDMYFGATPHEGIMGVSVPAGAPRHRKGGGLRKSESRKTAFSSSSAGSQAVQGSATISGITKSSTTEGKAAADGSTGISAAEDYTQAIKKYGPAAANISAASEKIWSPEDYVSYESRLIDYKIDFNDNTGKYEKVNVDEPYVAVDLTDYDQYDFVYGNYNWEHRQNPSGRDYIQNEENSNEMWYTVVIPDTSPTPVTTSVTVQKKWAGKPLDQITVYLLANGKVVRKAVLNEQKGWTYTFSGLEKYDSSGRKINYFVKEEPVDGYRSETATKGNTVTLTNIEQTQIHVKKKWEDGGDKDGIRPDSVRVRLTADGKTIDKVTLNAENNWTHTWSRLDKVTPATGEKIEYHVEEINVPDGYTALVQPDDNGFVITNRHHPDVTNKPDKTDKPDKMRRTDQQAEPGRKDYSKSPNGSDKLSKWQSEKKRTEKNTANSHISSLSPKTGDRSAARWVLVMIGAVSVIGVFYFKRKRS